MYSKKVSKVLQFSFSIARFTKSAPYIFNSSTNLVSIDSRSTDQSNKAFFLNAVWLSLVPLILIKHYMAGDMKKFHLTMGWWLGFLLLLCVQSMCRFFSEQHCSTFNGLTFILIRIKCKFTLSNTSPQTNINLMGF